MGLVEMLQVADFRRDVSRQAVARAIKHSVETPPVAALRQNLLYLSMTRRPVR